MTPAGTRIQPSSVPSSALAALMASRRAHKDTTLLTVQGLPAGTPVRLAVMDRFDGNVWNLSDRREARDSSNYVRVGTRIPTQDTGRAFDATFTVHEGLQAHASSRRRCRAARLPR